MIVGIDETGDFNPNSDKLNYFTAVLIDQNKNKFNIKKSQFNVWESSIPDSNRDKKGEAKGQLLTDEQLTEFYNQVLWPLPNVLYSVIRFNATENPIEIFEKHKKIEIEKLEYALAYYKKEARGNWADWYQRIIYWYKNRNYQHFVKIKCLENLVGQTFNYGYGWSQISYLLDDKDDSNIKNFGFKIDKDFITSVNTKVMWSELLKQFWIDYNSRYRTPIIGFVSLEEYPAIDTYGIGGNKSNLKKIFRDRTNFLASEDHFEIRMADIVGTILHRYQNKKKCSEIAESILTHLNSKKENYRQIVLNRNI